MKSGLWAIVVALSSSTAIAAPYSFSATQGTRSASVTFDTLGTNLIVTLTNTSGADSMVPIDILTAVFFDVSGSPLTLSRTSAVVPAGSTVLFGTTDPGNVVGGEWAYLAGLSGPDGRDYGISSTGLGLFGPGDRFPGSDLQPPPSPDGVQYGLTSAVDNPATGNTPVTGTNALIKHQVVFTLGGLPANFDPSTSINGVLFQYGTDLSEPRFPEPSTLALLAVSSLVLIRRRR